jgi:hypothetical protein
MLISSIVKYRVAFGGMTPPVDRERYYENSTREWFTVV